MGPHLPEEGEGGGIFAEINITPLTDIFLVLLIIFMVGASMAVDAAAGQGGAETSGVQVELPQGASQEIAPGQSDAYVVILPDGRVVIHGEEVLEGELVERLEQLRSRGGSSTLVLQADEGVPHGRVVAVMERAREAGFSKLAVATKGD